MSNLISSFFWEHIRIVNVEDLTKNRIITNNKITQYIFEHQIPFVSDYLFEPWIEKEFFELDGILYKNLFSYTLYLKKGCLQMKRI